MKAQEITRNMKHNFIWILSGLILIGFLGMASVCLASGDTWAQKADMPTARADLAACAVNGEIYVIGGGWGPFLSTVEVYDPSTNTWSTAIRIKMC